MKVSAGTKTKGPTTLSRVMALQLFTIMGGWGGHLVDESSPAFIQDSSDSENPPLMVS